MKVQASQRRDISEIWIVGREQKMSERTEDAQSLSRKGYGHEQHVPAGPGILSIPLR